ncbi:MAG: methyltransferase domain-containing protein [Gemmatimonadota bacterium]|jgi:hypothetical protein
MTSTTASSLFVIWSNGRHVEDRIVADLERRFELVRLYEVAWTPEHAIQNFRRFYADLPVRGVYHALAKGRGPFLAALVLDPSPHVMECDTSRGPRVVNAHFLEAKTEYRRWAGQLTIHCTETPFETHRDLTMILGTDAPSPEHLASEIRPGGVDRLLQDPVGAEGWTSEAELFEVLNRSVRHVVIGSPGAQPSDELLRRPHVNLLTDDYLTLHAVLDARPRLAHPHGGPHKVLVGDEWIDVRLRFVGDDFYDAAWAKSLLASRTKDAAGRYRPPDDEDFAALVYDRCAHPTSRSESDLARLSDMASGLAISEWPADAGTSPGAVRRWMERWLETRGYSSIEPKDASVAYDATFRVGAEGPDARVRSALGRKLSWWGHKVARAVGDLYWTARDQLLLRMPWVRPSHWSASRGLLSRVKRVARGPELFFLRRIALLGRGLLFVGRAFRCPCCGWSLRGFVGEWGILASNHDGYCPRCNAKARHRRLWLFLQERMSLSESSDLRLLEVAPWWAISRRLMRAPNVRFVGLDIARQGPQVTVVGDITRAPLASDSLDAALCIHTLEHIEKDRVALRELHRVLKPGGWAIVSVPLDLNGPTYEDSTVTDPGDREREFGERGHVRLYGLDIEGRLEEAGFRVELDRADQVPDATRRRFGLRDDENLWVCRKV